MFISKSISSFLPRDIISENLKSVKCIKEQDEITELIDGCIKEDRKSQEKLYRSYYPAMMNLCLRYTHNEQDAMEALNTGFYKVFKNIRSYNRGKASFYTWASTIIIHSCIDVINAIARNSSPMEITAASECRIPSEALERINSDELLAYIGKLSPALRTVFNLFVLEGYSHAEIGRLLNIGEGTSKWHLSESKKQLQKMILAIK